MSINDEVAAFEHACTNFQVGVGSKRLTSCIQSQMISSLSTVHRSAKNVGIVIQVLAR